MAVTVIATTILLLAVTQTAVCNSDNSKNNSTSMYQDPRTFFPGIKGNLTKIVWAHAVNSLAKLESALSSEDVMMLEADVVMGKLNTSNATNNIPIMAHPPAKESDLSLEDFLNLTISAQNVSKGVKLDFKSDEVFENSKPILAKFRQNLTFPVFLNADILRGPVNATAVPLNPKDFLKKAAEVMPDSTLSVGWTTRYGKEHNITEGGYTSEQIKAMIDALIESNIKQPVTYPVRAGLVANNTEVIKTLLKNSTFVNATLTIWSSEGDSVNVAQLSKLIKEVGVDKIYVDVPDDLRNKLDFSGASTITSAALTLVASLVLLLAQSRML
ncbi:protein FAM151B [Pseudomyrmex gracilis]|uniref:protein FAM151B n=1 Tax=Pseudomyrmex gracilis TaxID=219809 RepID=UPI0009954239|nr:protein FAM151B [Pseudomyrmex gracilis]